MQGGSYARVLLWSRLSMRTDFALALFHEVDALAAEAPYGSVILDLSDNQLGTMGEEGLLEILGVVQRHDWLVVRFGSEVNAAALGRALDQLGLGWYRVYIDQPWRSAAGLSDLAASLMVTTLDAVATSAAGMVAQTRDRSRLGCGDCATTRDSGAGLSAISAAMSSADAEANTEGVPSAWASQMATGVAGCLEEGRVIAVNFKWQSRSPVLGAPGNLGCMVVGCLPGGGERVVVLGQAKLNLEKNWGEALNEVLLNVEHWVTLCRRVDDSYSCWEEEEDARQPTAGDLEDIEQLGVRELADLPVCLALGGASVPGPLVERISNSLWRMGRRSRWFCFQMEAGGAGKRCSFVDQVK